MTTSTYDPATRADLHVLERQIDRLERTLLELRHDFEMAEWRRSLPKSLRTRTIVLQVGLAWLAAMIALIAEARVLP